MPASRCGIYDSAILNATGWEYGADLTFMMDLVEYWRNRFDWQAQERAINAPGRWRQTGWSTPRAT